MRVRLVLAVLLAVLSAPRAARAQEIQLTGPLSGGCILLLVRYVTPARAEWSTWLSGGVASTHGRAGTVAKAEGGAGGDLTWGALNWQGPQGSRRYRSGSLVELRAGLWGGAATRSSEALVEGGGVLHLGVLSVGGLDLRLGGGYGAFPDGRAPHVAATLALGLRLVPARFTHGGVCDPPVVPRPIAEASAIRLATTLRRAASGAGWEATAGVEITPSVLLLPWKMHWL